LIKGLLVSALQQPVIYAEFGFTVAMEILGPAAFRTGDCIARYYGKLTIFAYDC
jgi:hypothetical protein